MTSGALRREQRVSLGFVTPALAHIQHHPRHVLREALRSASHSANEPDPALAFVRQDYPKLEVAFAGGGQRFIESRDRQLAVIGVNTLAQVGEADGLIGGESQQPIGHGGGGDAVLLDVPMEQPDGALA